MKVTRYTLLPNGKVPQSMSDGGYFPKYNGGNSPQDYDLIGFTNGWIGLEEYTNKTDFETYIKSFAVDYVDIFGVTHTVQSQIDNIWNKSLP